MDLVAMGKKAVNWAGKYRYVLLILLIGICLMLIPDLSSKKEENTAIQPTQTVTLSLSQELEQILSKVKGAGKVSVMLTVDEGEQIHYQTDDTYNSAESHKHDTVIVTDSDRAQNGLIQKIDPPRYRGAVVVCEGADSPVVQLSVMEAVSKVTGLDSTRISILKMK